MKFDTMPPAVDLVKTGRKIREFREQAGYTVKDLQEYFNFENPQSVYKWQQGKNLPSVDNLLALSHLLGVTMEEILVPVDTGPGVVRMNIGEKNEHRAQERDAHHLFSELSVGVIHLSLPEAG